MARSRETNAVLVKINEEVVYEEGEEFDTFNAKRFLESSLIIRDCEKRENRTGDLFMFKTRSPLALCKSRLNQDKNTFCANFRSSFKTLLRACY